MTLFRSRSGSTMNALRPKPQSGPECKPIIHATTELDCTQRWGNDHQLTMNGSLLEDGPHDRFDKNGAIARMRRCLTPALGINLSGSGKMKENLDPSHIMKTATAFWVSKVLLTAVALDLLTTLGEDRKRTRWNKKLMRTQYACLLLKTKHT